jgi:hypothetical protein
LIKCNKFYRSKAKQSWKPASQNIQACTYKRAKGTGSLEQANTTKEGKSSLNELTKSATNKSASRLAPRGPPIITLEEDLQKANLQQNRRCIKQQTDITNCQEQCPKKK